MILNILANLAHFAQSYFSLIFNAINTYNYFWFDLTNKKIAVIEDKNLAKRDQCLQLFSSGANDQTDLKNILPTRRNE